MHNFYTAKELQAANDSNRREKLMNFLDNIKFKGQQLFIFISTSISPLKPTTLDKELFDSTIQKV